jgi:hypothetical protein
MVTKVCRYELVTKVYKIISLQIPFVTELSPDYPGLNPSVQFSVSKWQSGC